MCGGYGADGQRSGNPPAHASHLDTPQPSQSYPRQASAPKGGLVMKAKMLENNCWKQTPTVGRQRGTGGHPRKQFKGLLNIVAIISQMSTCGGRVGTKESGIQPWPGVRLQASLCPTLLPLPSPDYHHNHDFFMTFPFPWTSQILLWLGL